MVVKGVVRVSFTREGLVVRVRVRALIRKYDEKDRIDT